MNREAGSYGDRFVDPRVIRVIEELSAAGWSHEQFDRNQLGYAAGLVRDEMPPSVRSEFDRYWRTVAAISTLLRHRDIPHVVIKTRRSYPYGDNNVDVFIEEELSGEVTGLLSSSGWRMPTEAGKMKQRLIERGKIKLYPVVDRFVPAHLYMQVAWRYQHEVSFLPEDMIAEIAAGAEAPALEGEVTSLPVPNRTADLLLHSAEMIFENYRITLGEALYLNWLYETRSSDELSRIQGFARERGAGATLDTVLSLVEAGPDDLLQRSWPREFSGRELVACWGERLKFQWRKGGRRTALEEFAGYATFGFLYRVKRILAGEIP